VLAAGASPSRVGAVAFSLAGKLAAATSDRVIHLADASGERRDKFATKPGDAKVRRWGARRLRLSPV